MRDTVHGQSVARAPQRYDAAAVAFHWTVAALIRFLGALGLLFDDIPRGARPFWINVHASVCLVYFALVIARLGWRATHLLAYALFAVAALHAAAALWHHYIRR
jgi:cytochrome b561